MKNDISIGKTLASSFQYLFSNFNKRLKDGFPAVIFITIAFNILNYLMSNKIATNFTVIFFFLFVIIIAFIFSEGVETPMGDGKVLSVTGSRLVETGIKTFYLLTLIAGGVMIYNSVIKLFKK